MKTRIVVTVIIVFLLGFGGYKYLYQSHRDIKSEKAEYVVTSNELIEAFATNASDSEKIYLNKTIEVSGPVSSSTALSITLDDKIFCQFSDSLKLQPELGKTIKVKGRFIGYDDLLEDIKLDQSNWVD